MRTDTYDYGMIGLGTMGSNLVLNICDNGYSVAVYDKKPDKIKQLKAEAKEGQVYGANNLNDFIRALTRPRNIMLLVPAGAPVDSLINELSPLLDKEDLLIDLGNSHYTDTDRRIAQLEQQGLHFMGIGISGGEAGARQGPSIMPGGAKESYQRMSAVLRAIAAKADGIPCVTYLGPGSAGHYVKMVHNGIEYGLMQLIAETYQLMKEAGSLNNEEMYAIFTRWNNGPLHSFLLQITAEVINYKDEMTDAYLVDMILDQAAQKGTGGWTSQSSLDLGEPIPVINASVTARSVSALTEERLLAYQKLSRPINKQKTDKKQFIEELEQAVHFATIITYSQGLSLLQSASAYYKYNLNLADIASIWRAGCIIRAKMLENIKTAYTVQPKLASLITDDFFAVHLSNTHEAARKILITAINNGIPAPVLSASVAYYDALSSQHLPANLIQAMRDYFGAHTYKRTDREGVFHTEWSTNHN